MLVKNTVYCYRSRDIVIRRSVGIATRPAVDMGERVKKRPVSGH